MVSALRALGKAVATEEIPGPDGWSETAEGRTQVLTALERFLKEHL